MARWGCHLAGLTSMGLPAPAQATLSAALRARKQPQNRGLATRRTRARSKSTASTRKRLEHRPLTRLQHPTRTRMANGPSDDAYFWGVPVGSVFLMATVCAPPANASQLTRGSLDSQRLVTWRKPTPAVTKDQTRGARAWSRAAIKAMRITPPPPAAPSQLHLPRMTGQR